MPHTKSELSDPLFRELGQLSPDREAALAAYRRRDAAWDEMTDPVAFLRRHPLVDDDGKPGPGFLQSWLGLLLVLGLLGVFAYCLATFDMKFSGYFAGLFKGPEARGVVSLSARPGEMPVSGFPQGYRDMIQRINDYNRNEQWRPAAQKGMAVINNSEAMEAIRKEPAAHALLYEAVMASKMALRSEGLSNEKSVLDLAEKFRQEGGRPTFGIAFQKLLALFAIAGGEEVGRSTARGGLDQEVVADSDMLENNYGAQLSKAHGAQLRKMRVHSLIRLLAPLDDVREINRNALAKARWHRLATDLAVWRGDFPKMVAKDGIGLPFKRDYSALRKAWRLKGKDFLRCDLWYWQRLADLEPVFGKDFKIGGMEFDGNAAKFNANRIREALQ